MTALRCYTAHKKDGNLRPRPEEKKKGKEENEKEDYLHQP